MGQVPISVTIEHKFDSNPPAGWLPQGRIQFSAFSGQTIGRLLSSINEFRSPQHTITQLYNISGNMIQPATILPKRNVTYYI